MITTSATIRTTLILLRLCRVGMKDANKKTATINGIIKEKYQVYCSLKELSNASPPDSTLRIKREIDHLGPCDNVIERNRAPMT